MNRLVKVYPLRTSDAATDEVTYANLNVWMIQGHDLKQSFYPGCKRVLIFLDPTNQHAIEKTLFRKHTKWISRVNCDQDLITKFVHVISEVE